MFRRSYTTFGYSALATTKTTVSPCELIEVTVVLTNTGSVESDEVVQLYTRQPAATVPVPTIRLAAFEEC